MEQSKFLLYHRINTATFESVKEINIDQSKKQSAIQTTTVNTQVPDSHNFYLAPGTNDDLSRSLSYIEYLAPDAQLNSSFLTRLCLLK